MDAPLFPRLTKSEYTDKYTFSTGGNNSGTTGNEDFTTEDVLLTPTLQGKKVLVTGCSVGNNVGFVSAILYRLNGCTLTLLVRNKEKGEEAMKELRKYNRYHREENQTAEGMNKKKEQEKEEEKDKDKKEGQENQESEGKMKEMIYMVDEKDQPGLYYVVGDLEEPETMADCVEKAATFMNNEIDIILYSGGNGNTAGAKDTNYLGLNPLDCESYRTSFNIAVLSPMMICRAAQLYMRNTLSTDFPTKSKRKAIDPNICMITSEAANTCWPSTLPYNIGKAAQHSLIKQLAFEYASMISSSSSCATSSTSSSTSSAFAKTDSKDNIHFTIRVNGVSVSASHSDALDRIAHDKNIPVPDYVKLRAAAHPLQRIASMIEIANAVIYMTSPLASFTTGEIYTLDGGLSTTNWFNASKLMKAMRK